jgi:hypothetical protein
MKLQKNDNRDVPKIRLDIRHILRFLIDLKYHMKKGYKESFQYSNVLLCNSCDL